MSASETPSEALPESVSPPNGGKNRGWPPKANSLRAIAAAARISVRMLERAMFVRRYGVPELVAMCERGELKIGAAEYVARWPQEEQREACAKGAKYLRELIPFVRAGDAEEKGRQTAEKGQRAVCPHCGGAL